jgi:hypothetical protein
MGLNTLRSRYFLFVACIKKKKKHRQLIISNLAVFDDMIKEYNVKDTKVQEVLTLDFEDLTKDG